MDKEKEIMIFDTNEELEKFIRETLDSGKHIGEILDIILDAILTNAIYIICTESKDTERDIMSMYRYMDKKMNKVLKYMGREYTVTSEINK